MSEPIPGVNPRHFLDGGMGREEAASAYLATLLEQSRDFRSEFFRIAGIPEIPNPNIEVEHDLRDITITGDNTILIVEVKIDDGSKTKGQLCQYYKRVKRDSPTAIVHCVYLARTREVGRSEVELIENCPSEYAVTLGWTDIASACNIITDFDNTFVKCGIKIILDVIKRRQNRSAREWSDEELRWREIIRIVGDGFKQQGLRWKTVPDGCKLWIYGPITIVAKCMPPMPKSFSTDDFACELELSFRLAGPESATKFPERPSAKRWIEKIKRARRWHSFELDSQENWFEGTVLITGTRQGAIDHIHFEVHRLITLIYDDVEKM
ncbi:MAG: hypothetical protein ACO1RA_15435 [Planctomycetaceae bacterium]